MLNLKSEWSNLVEALRKVGALGRVVLLATFFLAVSSVASLADVIFEWKGFILETIDFYDTYFVVPVTLMGSLFGLSYSEAEVHAATFLSISVATGMRMLAVGQKVAFDQINERYGSNLFPNLGLYYVLGIGFPIGLWIWYGVSDQVIRAWLVAIVVLLYPLFIVIPKFIMAKFQYEYFERGKFSYVFSYYAYLMAVAVVVGVLAATNVGLNRPYPPAEVDSRQGE